MNATWKALLAITVIAAVVGGVLIHYGGGGESQESLSLKAKDSKDLTMTDGVGFVEVVDGKVAWKVGAQGAAYDMTSGLLKLEKPSAKQMKDSVPEYEMSGDTGTYDTEKRILSMEGSVKARSRTGYTLDTDSILYDVRKKYASTNSPVAVLGEGLEMSGVGMVLDLRAETMKILKDVKINAVPQVIEENVNIK